MRNDAEDYVRIEQNAHRLLEDAKFLFERERFKSAISLSILAAEEIGKISILALPNNLRSKDHDKHLSSHREKLIAFSTMVLFQMMEKVEEETLKLHGLENSIEGRKKLREMTRHMTETYPEVLGILGIKEENDMTEEFVIWFVHGYLQIFGSKDGLGDAVGQIGTGIANKLKQYGFYVDVSSFDNPSDEPDDDNARRWILAVEQTLQSNVMRATMAALDRKAGKV